MKNQLTLPTQHLKVIIIICLFFLSSALYAQGPISLDTYNPLVPEVSSNESITLKNGFYVPNGNNFRAYISGLIAPVTFVAKPSSNQNYTKMRVFNIAGVKTAAQVNQTGRSTADIQEVIEYQDGLGRTIQAVIPQGSISGKDIINPEAYDLAGRQPKSFLPYTSNTGVAGNYRADALKGTTGYNNSGQYVFYQQMGQNRATTAYPYSVTVLEPTVMNRSEQGSVGSAWQPADAAIAGSGHTVKQEVTVSKVSDGIKNWVVDGSRIFVTSNLYKAGLTKTVTKGPNWVSGKVGTEEVYTDSRGRVRAKKVYETETKPIITYYIYNNNAATNVTFVNSYGKGELSHVLTPGVTASTINENDTSFTKYVYAYRYDERSRTVAKKIPGVGWTYLVYNSLDQPVLTQDSVQRTSNEWTYIKYDALGRQVMTGRYVNSSTRLTVQALVNASSVNFEKRDEAGTNGYTSLSFPAGNGAEVYTVNYFDDYDLPTSCPWKVPGVGCSQVVNGLPTATYVKILNTSTYLWRVNFYDEKGQLLQVKSQNHMGGTDEIFATYDFSGKLLSSKRTSTLNSVVTTILETTSYDPVGRILQTKLKINSQPEIVIAAYTYNELDQMVSKKLHSIDLGVNYLQDLNYTYNEQGWLKSINDISINSTGNTKFGMQFAYETAPFPQYNGNVGQTKWKTARTATSPQLSYDYKYDNLDRLTAAESSTGAVKDKNYSEYASYDQMGNIKTLGRYALISATGTRGQIDSLKYTYNINRHSSINDVSTAVSTVKSLGFNDKVQVVDEYVYDGNGRIVSDKNSDISSILYNAANLPRQITWTGTPARKLEYMYSADGSKLQKKYTSGTTVTTTDYMSGIQYLTNASNSAAIDFIQTSEGRAHYNGSLFVFEYDLKDNLGNTRVTINADPVDATQRTAKVIQENSYYPFGMVMPNADINFAAGVKNNYLYNGKELQEELGQLDYGARFYDPAIGRWSVLDPLAESHYDQSAYSYVLNNPIKFIDPFGLKEGDPYDSEGNPIFKDWGDFDPYEDEIYLKGVNITNYDKMQERLYQEGQDRINTIVNGLISTIDGLNRSASIYQDNKREAAQKKADQDRKANIARNENRKAFLKGHYGKSAKPGSEQPLSHAQELEKYGKVAWGYNFSIGASVGSIGGIAETGTIITDKGWARNYKTVYYAPGFASPSASHSFLFISALSDKNPPTFSDWNGFAKGMFGSVDFISLGAGLGSNYSVWGIGVSFAPASLNFMKESRGTGGLNVGVTTWQGPAYQISADGPTGRYINTMKFNAGY